MDLDVKSYQKEEEVVYYLGTKEVLTVHIVHIVHNRQVCSKIHTGHHLLQGLPIRNLIFFQA